MLHVLGKELWFPPVDQATREGIVAIGGDLSVDRLLLAYRSGIFPWFNADEPPIWWCPDPRMILLPEALNVSHSMRGLLRRGAFDFSMDTDFTGVIDGCRSVPRPGQDGTWITDDIVHAYTELFHLGYAHSGEAWLNGSLVGGLYGIRLGKAFFGESMFSRVSNASKFAFIRMVQQLAAIGVTLIDCQIFTPHLASLGATLIPRAQFMSLLSQTINASGICPP